MSTINPDNDLFLVQRNSNSYQVSAENLMSTINYESEPYDYMLIQRDGASYKVSAKDVKDQLGGSDVGSVVITKGIITPSTDVKAGDTLTGTATYAGNVEPTVFYHKWYVDGVQDTSATTNTFEAVEGSVTYQLCITDPNNTTPVEGGLSDAVTVSPATKPNADMHGLRFDHNRQTKMYRAADAAIETYTFSTWFKWTKNGSHSFIFSKGDNNDGLRIGASGEVGVYDSSGLTDSNLSVTENIWAHIVLKVTAKVVELYVNGIKAAISKTLSTVGPANEPISIGYFSTSDNNITNGYMSDVYFVDGQALPPETFGKEFDLGWGPLDSSVVKDNIGSVENPYDSRPNFDQKWSDYLVISGNYFAGSDATQAFDGDSTTSAYVLNNTQNQSLTFTPDTPIPCSTVQFKVSPSGDSNAYYRINGGPNITAGSGKTVTDITELVSLEINQGAQTNSVGLRWIKIDGRELIDGPADESQVWSDYVSINGTGEFSNNRGPTNLFDGSTADSSVNACVYSEGTGRDNYAVWSSPTQFNNVNLRIFFLCGQLGSTFIALDDNYYVQSTAIFGEWVDFGTVSFNEIRWGNETGTPANNGSFMYAIEVDGKLLIDSPAQWNTSQVWSDNVDTESFSIEPNRGPDKGFDGDLSTSCAVTAFNDIYYINLKDDSFKNQTVEIYTSNPDATVDRYISLNGVSVNVPSGSARWLQIGAAADDGTATIGIGSNSASKRTVFYAIRIGGEILVDGGSFGTNGFYLPFDPAATGEYWSDGLSCPNGFSSTATPSKAFDGSLTTAAVSSSASQAITFATSDFTSGPYTVAVYADNKHTVTVDGAATVKDGGTGTIAHRLPGTVNSFSSIVITPVTSLRSDVAGIEVNGKILVDHNSIGTDDSGNGNHFHDQNFIVGNTSQVWSELITGSPQNPKKAFNGKIAGNYADGCMPTAVNESCSIDFGDTFESADSVKLYFIRLQDVCELSVNGSSVTTQFDGSAINVFTETVDVSGTGLNTIFWNYVPSNGAPAYSYVSLLGIEVDGELLIDANIGIDTVTDTPMRNYAVLESGTNGNLVNPNNSINSGNVANQKSSNPFYFEVVPSTASASTSNNSDWIAVSESTGLGGVTNSMGMTSTGRVWTGSGWGEPGEVATFKVGDVVGVAVDGTNINFFVNGVSAGATQTFPGTAPVGPNFRAAGRLNCGQQPFAASNVTYDQETGIVTLPATSPNTSQVWSNFASGQTAADQPKAYAFDGDFGTFWQSTPGETLSLSLPTAQSGRLRIYTNVMTSVVINDSITVDTSGYPESGARWFDIGVFQDISTIEVVRSGVKIAIRGYEINGRILVDADPTINNSQKWSDYLVCSDGFTQPQTNAFDGNPETHANTASVRNVFMTFNRSFENVTSLRIKCRKDNTGITNLLEVSGNGLTTTPISPDIAQGLVSIPLTSTTISDIRVTCTDQIDASPAACLSQIEINGKLLVDAEGFPGGTYNTLFQTWEQQYATYYKAKVAAADVLIAGLRAHAQTYSPGTDYCEGSVIKAFGELWIAINNSPSTTFADLPALMTHPNWEKLGISA